MKVIGHGRRGNYETMLVEIDEAEWNILRQYGDYSTWTLKQFNPDDAYKGQVNVYSLIRSLGDTNELRNKVKASIEEAQENLTKLLAQAEKLKAIEVELLKVKPSDPNDADRFKAEPK